MLLLSVLGLAVIAIAVAGATFTTSRIAATFALLSLAVAALAAAATDDLFTIGGATALTVLVGVVLQSVMDTFSLLR